MFLKMPAKKREIGIVTMLVVLVPACLLFYKWKGNTVNLIFEYLILLRKYASNLKSEGPVVCYTFTVNYILGVGCLGIPYAFLQSGIILGIALVLLLTFVSYITVMWIAVATQQVQI